ncbi:MAG: hypothetical protein IJ770_04015 [Alphaproteobacteria bacterium]|nr:hypothetical protein [Alphaproteobacteria bacterium]
MKKILLLCLGFCCFATNVSAASFEYAVRQCKDRMQKNPPKIEIAYNYGALKLDNTKTSEGIEEVFKSTHPNVKVKRINGLTTLSPYAQLESSIQSESVNNRICYYPRNIRINIGYKPVVYIASDISKAGCRFILTVRHEQTHLDIGHLSLELFVRRLKEDFPHLISEIGPVVKTRSEEIPIDEMSKQMNTTYHNHLKILFDDFVQKLLAQNAHIDTDENYQKESELCSD